MKSKLSTLFLSLAFFCGMAQANDYNLLLADHTQKTLFIRSADGDIVWKQPSPSLYEAWVLDDGAVVYSTGATIEKIIPDLKTGEGGTPIWTYRFGTDAPQPLPKGITYTCTPLENGHFMVTESGTYRLVELDEAGKIVNTIQLPIPKEPSGDSLRLTRHTPQNTWLAAYFAEGKFIEIDAAGTVLREIDMNPFCIKAGNSAYEAVPLADGRQLVSCGPQNQVLILDANGKVDWKLTAEDLPAGMNFNWITRVVPLGNGNLIVCNYCKGKAETKAFEITPAKEIVWTLTDPRIKGLTTLQVLTSDFRPLKQMLPVAEPHAMPPNVILINCDDLGYGDIGCYGAKDIRTPHLDRMAAEGMRFTDFSVTSALCTPSRSALMTGKYPGRTGLATGVLRPDSKRGLAPEEVTLAEIMKFRGYTTGCIGKWHLGFVEGMRPMDQGFDSYYGVLHNLDHFETDYFEKVGGMPVLRGDAVEKRPAVPAEMTGLYTAEALKFIESNCGKPFFLYIGHAMPHKPFDASPRFKGKSQRGLYGDAVEELDDSAGQILDRLRTLGIAERTLVIFTSDNGPEKNTPGTAAPLTGTKHTVFEGGLRVPCIAWMPGHVPAGMVCDEFVSTLDVLPTMAHLGGSEPPRDPALDGFDILPVLLGEKGAHSPRETLYSLYGKNRQSESLREKHWKLHLGSSNCLYDLDSDLGEMTDVASQHPEVVERLTRKAIAIRTETMDP